MFKENQLIKGNQSCNTAIVTLWTRKEEVAKAVDKDRYCFIGQLYSAERGIDILVRNLFSNPKITNIIITGKDLTNSGKILRDFFIKGVEKGKSRQGVDCWKIKSGFEGYIGLDIPKKQIDMLRKSINIGVIDDPGKINSFKPVEKGRRTRFVYPIKDISLDNYKGEDSVYIVRQKSINQAWLQILDYVMKFGKVTPTQFDSRQKEIIDVISIITGEDPINPNIPDYFPFDKKHFEDYSKGFLSDSKTEGISYTYGNRMRSFFGKDQINLTVKKLAKDLNTRQAVVSLWDSEKDLDEKESPCLNHIWVRVRDYKVFMSATLRSNDMFGGYPENALALRLLQEKIRKELTKEVYKGLPDHEFALGDLVVISHSAHIYEESWEPAKNILKKNYRGAVSDHLLLDGRGSFFITLDESNKLINVDYLTPDGEKITSFQGNSALDLRDVLVRENVVSTPGHGIYIGVELCKAELSMKHDIPYEQDMDVVIT